MKIGTVVVVIGAIVGGYLAVYQGMTWVGAGVGGLIAMVGMALSAIQPDEEDTDEEPDFKVDTDTDKSSDKSNNKYSLEDL